MKRRSAEAQASLEASLARASTPGVKSVVTAIDSYGARPPRIPMEASGPTPVQRGGNAPKRSYSL